VVQGTNWLEIALKRIKPLLCAPIVLVLALQFVSFLVVLICAYTITALTNFHLPLVMAVLLQGAFAAALSSWRGLAIWWLLIQFFFPGAVIATQFLQLPPSLFLAAFIVLVTLYWTTFRTQVPFFPSGPATWKAVADMLPQGRVIQFVDVGSGMGGLVTHLARCRPDSRFTGIEVAPLPWLVSFLRALVTHNCGHSRFIRGDYAQLSFGHYDVVFAYLSPAAMSALWRQARAEMSPGTLLISYEFPIPGVQSHVVSTPDARGAVLYGWYM
jgi:hypothetical protein